MRVVCFQSFSSVSISSSGVQRRAQRHRKQLRRRGGLARGRPEDFSPAQRGKRHQWPLHGSEAARPEPQRLVTQPPPRTSVNWQQTLQHLLRGAPERHARRKAVKEWEGVSRLGGCYFRLMGFFFFFFASCCSVSIFSPLVRQTWLSLMNFWDVARVRRWYCNCHQLLRLGPWPQDQKLKWWFNFLYCSVWIYFNSIVCFTVFSISSETKCL